MDDLGSRLENFKLSICSQKVTRQPSSRTGGIIVDSLESFDELLDLSQNDSDEKDWSQRETNMVWAWRSDIKWRLDSPIIPEYSSNFVLV